MRTAFGDAPIAFTTDQQMFPYCTMTKSDEYAGEMRCRSRFAVDRESVHAGSRTSGPSWKRLVELLHLEKQPPASISTLPSPQQTWKGVPWGE